MERTRANAGFDYTHEEPESFLSRISKFAARLIKLKSLIERDMTKGAFNQAPADIPKSLAANYQIEKTKINGRPVWHIRPKQGASEQVVVFLHGGAYIYNITTQHWLLIKELLTHTRASFIVPDYPLAPQAHCDAVLDHMTAVYELLLTTVSPDNITFMGDSAGAGLALAFGQHLRNEQRPPPRQLILLSPFLDITMSHEDIPDLEKVDHVLAVRGLRLAGEAYAGARDHHEYRVSPIHADLGGLPKIAVFIGTHDIFIADSRELREKLRAAGGSLKFFEYPQMMHVWMLVLQMPEARHAIAQISKLIGM